MIRYSTRHAASVTLGSSRNKVRSFMFRLTIRISFALKFDFFINWFEIVKFICNVAPAVLLFGDL